VPTYGPINEYGSSTTENAKAAEIALGARSGENKTKLAKADWNKPSVNCPVQRTVRMRFNLEPLATGQIPIGQA